jgi:hypothetical protein
MKQTLANFIKTKHPTKGEKRIASFVNETLANFIKTKHPTKGEKKKEQRERERETTLSKFEPKKAKLKVGHKRAKGTNHVKNQTLI